MIQQLKPLWQRWLGRRIPPAARIKLDHRRIFILPTRTGATFVLVVFLMLLVSINYQNSLAYGLTFLLLSVGILAILHTYRNLGGLVLSAGLARSVFVGEPVQLRLRLESAGHAHQALGLGWNAQALQPGDVTAEGLTEVELTLPAETRGWLRAPRLRVESVFPLGIFRAWSWLDLEQTVLIYPRPIAGAMPLLQGVQPHAQDDGQATQGAGVDDYQGLRSYQPGDNRRRLHWKAYSRGQGLLVKDFTDLSGHELCLDFMALGGDIEERLSRLCYWVLELSQRQQPFALRLPGFLSAVDSSDAHRETCLRQLALFGNRS
ncbi:MULTISPECIES: DUF58 domain-containing protein [Pseudomonas]|uniref:Uncharacterized protein n=1 Tax=Pseudomonas cichorii TaxID=36746 RepID=A0A3M4VDL8_PSECI|nr:MULTISPECIES: DUF58 domain-containing protein [Pseudomonas]AHF68190.1 hypothetical protein PCH70_30370 [Pseudomonas cichorii JBC1]QVE15228.1 DUF58 domain-containing protein [Pseudomonas cichorii]RMR49928.1 hypothetical protein ALP84_03329 [Pseudomonas cichorii]SDO28181.1 Uncharacterized conserved protein, DUF58 family, contains vWF domain [Pseudomonas cichorii]GFM75078.1 hypothetical protein PSCICM_08970 [Pseudomonas cichorii]